MPLFGIFLQVGILWFLITFFTRSTNSRTSLNETWIVIFGMMIVGLLSRYFLNALLGPFVFFVNVAALYFLVDKVCGASRSATIRICVWYFVISILISVILAVLTAT